MLLPFEVQPVLRVESPVAPIGELLPQVGWRGESVHPFGVDERLGRGDPNITPANLKQEYERQQQNQAGELGEEVSKPERPNRDLANQDPDVIDRIQHEFPELTKSEILDFLGYMYTLYEFFGESLAPADIVHINTRIIQLISSGDISEATIRATSQMAEMMDGDGVLVCTTEVDQSGIPCVPMSYVTAPEAKPEVTQAGAAGVAIGGYKAVVALFAALGLITVATTYQDGLWSIPSGWVLRDYGGKVVLSKVGDDAEAQPRKTPWGWENSPPHNKAKNELAGAGHRDTLSSINGVKPSQEEAERLAEATGGTVVRAEKGHHPGGVSTHHEDHILIRYPDGRDVTVIVDKVVNPYASRKD